MCVHMHTHMNGSRIISNCPQHLTKKIVSSSLSLWLGDIYINIYVCQVHLVPLKQESTSSFEHKNLPPILGSLTDKFSSKFLLRQYNSYMLKITNGLTHLMRGKFSVAPIICKQHCFTYLLSKTLLHQLYYILYLKCPYCPLSLSLYCVLSSSESLPLEV